MRGLLLFLGAILLSGSAFAACGSGGGGLDINCDGTVRLAVLGDSFVVGTGDLRYGGRGGYVLRARRKLRNVTVDGFGTKGLDTRQLLTRIIDAFARGPRSSPQEASLKGALLESDIVVLDLGRNDRWFFGPPSEAYRNLKRIRSLIRTKVGEATGVAPVIVTAVLMLPNRGSQGPWVKDLNRLILKSHRPEAPANLRFDLVSKRLLSSDQLHPTSIGYDELAKTFVDYILKVLPRLVNS